MSCGFRGQKFDFFIETHFVTWDDGSVCCVGLLWMIVRGFRVQMMLYKESVAGFNDCQDLWEVLDLLLV